jgi:putative proteasome-type protease
LADKFKVNVAGCFRFILPAILLKRTTKTLTFQIGEAKYGKPILDRVINPATSLDDAAKCALISMDSTLRSNISVGLPLDLLVYENHHLAVSRFVTIDEKISIFR